MQAQSTTDPIASAHGERYPIASCRDENYTARLSYECPDLYTDSEANMALYSR
jgi:hypothetical protein